MGNRALLYTIYSSLAMTGFKLLKSQAAKMKTSVLAGEALLIQPNVCWWIISQGKNQCGITASLYLSRS